MSTAWWCHNIYLKLLTAFQQPWRIPQNKAAQTKPTQQNLLNQIYLTKFIEPNQTYQNNFNQTNLSTKLLKLNLPNEINKN